ncbi:MAG: hypothetical protein ABI877_06980 [Gemmatimonadaceae bacterium]
MIAAIAGNAVPFGRVDSLATPPVVWLRVADADVAHDNATAHKDGRTNSLASDMGRAP